MKARKGKKPAKLPRAAKQKPIALDAAQRSVLNEAWARVVEVETARAHAYNRLHDVARSLASGQYTLAPSEGGTVELYRGELNGKGG